MLSEARTCHTLGLCITCRFSPNPGSLVTQAGAQCSIYFNGSFYDNAACARKGVTTLAWPKPKLKFNFHKDHVSPLLLAIPRLLNCSYLSVSGFLGTWLMSSPLVMTGLF